jgi:hypothetical protein
MRDISISLKGELIDGKGNKTNTFLDIKDFNLLILGRREMDRLNQIEIAKTNNSDTEYLGCGSSSCYIEKPKGQATNGPCRCFDGLSTKDQLRIKKALFRERKYRSIV